MELSCLLPSFNFTILLFQQLPFLEHERAPQLWIYWWHVYCYQTEGYLLPAITTQGLFPSGWSFHCIVAKCIGYDTGVKTPEHLHIKLINCLWVVIPTKLITLSKILWLCYLAPIWIHLILSFVLFTTSWNLANYHILQVKSLLYPASIIQKGLLSTIF